MIKYIVALIIITGAFSNSMLFNSKFLTLEKLFSNGFKVSLTDYQRCIDYLNKEHLWPKIWAMAFSIIPIINIFVARKYIAELEIKTMNYLSKEDLLIPMETREEDIYNSCLSSFTKCCTIEEIMKKTKPVTTPLKADIHRILEENIDEDITITMEDNPLNNLLKETSIVLSRDYVCEDKEIVDYQEYDLPYIKSEKTYIHRKY